MGALARQWYFAGRDHLFFALETDIHHGRLIVFVNASVLAWSGPRILCEELAERVAPCSRQPDFPTGAPRPFGGSPQQLGGLVR